MIEPTSSLGEAMNSLHLILEKSMSWAAAGAAANRRKASMARRGGMGNLGVEERAALAGVRLTLARCRPLGPIAPIRRPLLARSIRIAFDKKRVRISSLFAWRSVCERGIRSQGRSQSDRRP